MKWNRNSQMISKQQKTEQRDKKTISKQTNSNELNLMINDLEYLIMSVRRKSGMPKIKDTSN